MNQSLDHLPQEKQDELSRIAAVIRRACTGVEKIVLFGSYARGDWKDGLHQQGRGRLTIHKKSDYDILVITTCECDARNVGLWDKVKEECGKLGLSACARIIARDIHFVNFKLEEGQYFFTDVTGEGILLYDSGRAKFAERRELTPAEKKEIAQYYLDEVFTAAKEFYGYYQDGFRKCQYKTAAFLLNQACEHAYKAVLAIFGGECPQEHHLDVLGDMAADYCPELAGLLPRQTGEEKEVFELLDYAYIGARYDRDYKITKEQLQQLGLCVRELLEVIERNCKNKIDGFTEDGAS